MGGPGSGRWDRHSEKTSVEECYTIDVGDLARNGMLYVGRTGARSWNDQFGEQPFRVDFSTVLDDYCRPFLLLSYRRDDPWDDSDGADFEDVSLPIRLQTSQPYYGGQRWWFTCPLVVGGIPCNRRVGILYLPDDARYFGCRHCHELVYRREPDPFEHADALLKVFWKRMERLNKKHG